MSTITTPTDVHTPPHFPTFNVRASHTQVEAAMKLVFPTANSISMNALESGKSFNNRIYFVDVEVNELGHDSTKALVLKLSGHYFGPRKVQNEIAALQLIHKYCPAIPVPQVLAWSEDGKSIWTVDGHVTHLEQIEQGQLASRDMYANAVLEQGWTLTTRLAGRTLTLTDLDELNGSMVFDQLASYIHAWRTLIPETSCIGNLRRHDLGAQQLDPVPVFHLFGHGSVGSLNTKETSLDNKFTVGGLILACRYDPTTLTNPLSHYTYIVNDQLHHLRQSPALEPLRQEIEPMIQDLIDHKLPRLPLLRRRATSASDGANAIVGLAMAKFTHLDLAPRNILVARSGANNASLEVTGLVDFEFSAFLPPEEEFINMEVRQSSDWPESHYEQLLRSLVRLGCEVPHRQGKFSEASGCTKRDRGSCICDDESFAALCVLFKIIENIKPWWVIGDSHKGDELKEVIEKAARAVRNGLAELNQFLIVA